MGILRFLLALSVLLVHLKTIYNSSLFNYEMVDVHVAVNAFFIVSGFFMALILNEKYTGTNGSYKLFITNRFIRIFPIYWVILVLYIIFYLAYFNKAPLEFQNYYNNIHSFPALITILKNIFLFNFIIVPRNINIFNIIHIQQIGNYLIDSPAWSVSIELMFYLIAPFIARLKFKKTVLLLFFYLFIQTVLQHTFLNHLINAIELYFLPNEFLFFLLGILSYWLYTKIRKLTLKKEIITFIGFAIVFFTLFYNLLPFFRNNFIEQNMYYLFILGGIPFFFVNTKKNKLSNILGELSYPIYISQELILNVLRNYINFGGLNKNIVTFIELATVIVFSYMLYIFIMKPLDQFRASRIKQKHIVPSKTIKKIPALALVTD